MSQRFSNCSGSRPQALITNSNNCQNHNDMLSKKPKQKTKMDQGTGKILPSRPFKYKYL